MFRLKIFHIVLIIVLLGIISSPVFAQTPDGSDPSVVDLPTAEVPGIILEDDAPVVEPLPEEVPPPVIVDDSGFGLSEVLLVVSLIANMVVIAFAAYKSSGGNIFNTVDSLRDNPEFTALAKQLADSTPPATVQMIYNLALTARQVIDTVEDVATFAVNVTAPGGADRLEEFELFIPPNTSDEVRRHAIQQAKAAAQLAIINSKSTEPADA